MAQPTPEQSATRQPFTELYDKRGELLGVLLSPEAWAVAREAVEARFAPAAAEPEIAERLDDWETLKAYWDFPYPVDTDVHCGHCGNHTEDFQADDPRRFRLTAASLGGLVTFVCMNCRSKIIKRHFKKEIVSETQPFQEAKDPL
ncbi:MAG: hypothetical protein AB7D57_09795, partial [Desulfovibrionaceae bacterium]